MSDLEIRSWYEFDEHRHLFMTQKGEPVASIRYSQLSDGRDNAVNCMVAVKFLFGADDAGDIDPLMEYQRCNLTNKTSANGWGKVADALQGRGNWQWDNLIQKSISLTLRSWFEGTSSHAPLEWVEAEDLGPPFLLEPLVSSTGMTLFYSPPGAGKSFVALGVAVSVATGYPIFGAVPIKTGPVVYVDFEDVKEVHDKRASAILRSIGKEGEMPHIEHYKVSGKFIDSIGKIRSVVREVGAVLVIVDSLGKARNTDPSDGDATIKLTNAIESLGMPVLAIDHVTKADNRDIKNGSMKNPNAVFAIGSQFSTAGARLGWFFQEMSDSKPGHQRLNIHNTKHNHVAEQESRSLSIELTSDEFHALTRVKFKVWDTMIFEELTVEGTDIMVLKWMTNSKNPSVTATEVQEAIGLDRSAVAKAFGTSPWFKKGEKSGRSQYYVITDEGSVAFTRLTDAKGA